MRPKHPPRTVKRSGYGLAKIGEFPLRSRLPLGIETSGVLAFPKGTQEKCGDVVAHPLELFVRAARIAWLAFAAAVAAVAAFAASVAAVAAAAAAAFAAFAGLLVAGGLGRRRIGDFGLVIDGLGRNEAGRGYDGCRLLAGR